MLSFVKGGSVVLLLFVCLLKQVNSLQYSELRSLNVSCRPRDSCDSSYIRSPTEEGDTCECDATCHRRGTCCIDSPHVDPRPSTRNEICSGEIIAGFTHYYYFNDSRTFSFFQVIKCDRQWSGSFEVRKLCEMEGPVDGVDFTVGIPVTNTYSGISYKNYYCALCNNDIEGAVFWDAGIYEEDYKSLISDRFNVQPIDDTHDGSDDITEGSGPCIGSSILALVFNEEQGSYGYWDYCSYGTPRFVWVTVELTIPEQIQYLVKGCRSNLISLCSPGWRDVRIRILCGSYLGIIKGPPQILESGILYHEYFRNAHCALCNNVTNFEGYSCEQFSAGALIATPTYPVSASVLLEYLLSDKERLRDYKKFI